MKNKVTLVLIIILIGILVFSPESEGYRPWWRRRRRPPPRRPLPPPRSRANDVRSIGGLNYVTFCPSVSQYNTRTSYPGKSSDNHVRYCTSTLSSRNNACKKKACDDSYFKRMCRDECASV